MLVQQKNIYRAIDDYSYARFAQPPARPARPPRARTRACAACRVGHVGACACGRRVVAHLGNAYSLVNVQALLARAIAHMSISEYAA